MEVATPLERPIAQPRLPRPTPSGDPSDLELVQGIVDGSRVAFEQLYGRYVRSIFGLALRKLGDREMAEEATQEVFTALWRSARSYQRERGPVTAWLYAIARNAIVDRARRRRDTPVEFIEEEPSGEPGPADQAESSWVSWRMHRALSQLPAREREVIELAYWSGLAQSEVAEYLDIPLGTVKTRTRSALQRLADILEQEEIR
ncbi:MAG: RNA polymerase sigma factor [Gaiellaceae bacterium]